MFRCGRHGHRARRHTISAVDVRVAQYPIRRCGAHAACRRRDRLSSAGGGAVIKAAIAFFLLAQTTAPAPPTDDELLKLFAGLRVADVADGMDVAGLRGIGLVDPRIQPLWK